MMKKFYIAQIALLAGGSLVAWKAVYDDFARFFDAGGNVLQVAGCTVPNPVTTPCFYGAFGFIGALIWAVIILKKSDMAMKVRQEKYLSWFLVGCTLFGWFNFTKLYLDYMAGSQIGCSGAPMTIPFLTPCFFGSLFFLSALLSSWLILHKEGKALG
jgi:hypothetical protein